MRNISFVGVDWPQELDQVNFILVLDLLFLHSQVIVILVVSINYDLIQVADDSNMRVSLNVIFSPLLKLSFFHKNVRLVHDLQIESVVLINAFDFIVLCVFNQLQDVIALHDNLLLLFSGHIVA